MPSHAEYMREYRKKHPELKEKEKQYQKDFLEKNLDYHKNWRKDNPKWLEQNRAQVRRYRKRHPKKREANLLARKVEGDSECADCGATEDLQKHHPDYSKPLEVVTLCRVCHVRRHINEKQLK